MSAADYNLIREEIQPYRTGSRTESAALLAWFLNAVWRLEPEDIDDAICDGGGDKGIDALVVDDELSEITVFQAKYRRSAGAEQGDANLRNLVGAAAYFASQEAVDQLLRSEPNPELARLLGRARIRERVGDGARVSRLVFVTNGVLDVSGRDYVAALASHQPPLDVWDCGRLAPVASRTRRPALRSERVVLSAVATPTALRLDGTTQMAVGLVGAQQLVALPGIEDSSLFARNVRLGLDRTRINREVGETVQQVEEHRLFPAYHNGLTMLTHGLEVEGNELHLNGVTVVNGCQSLLALHRNRARLSPELKVLVKVVEVDPQSDLNDKITYRTNNQNPVDIRDQRSTDRIQRDLQALMQEHYGDELAYGIRAGEHFSVAVLDNQVAAQLIMAVYRGEPWAAVRKVRLFDEDYRRIFNRSVNAHHLYLLHRLEGIIGTVRPDLRPELVSSFSSVRLTLIYLLGRVLQETDEGKALLETPERWLPELNEQVNEALTDLARDVVQSVNFYIEAREQEARQEGREEEFDPKVTFKSKIGVSEVERDVISHSRRQARRDPSYLFRIQSVR